jgi:polysaccharide pyruvyl transferase CsaB
MQPVRVLIWGYYGYYNLGDEAMLSGMIHYLTTWCPDIQITVYTLRPGDTRRRHGVSTLSSIPPKRKLGFLRHRLKIYQTLWQSDVFILGGGDLLRDSTKTSVAKIWLKPLQSAIFLRRKTLIWGVSVGEIWRSETRQYIKKVLDKAGMIVVRDQRSRHILKDLEVEKAANLASDLALAATSQYRANENSPLKSSSKPAIGISFRDIARRISFIQEVDAQAFQKTMAKIVDGLIEEFEAEVHVVPFQSYPKSYRAEKKPSPDDYVSSLAMLNHSQYANDVHIYDYLPNLGDLLNVFESMDLVIGTRLHSLILAAAIGVPIIGIAYDPKVNSFMQEVNQDRFCFSIEKLSSRNLLKHVGYILKNNNDVREDLRLALQAYQQPDASTYTNLKDYVFGPQA